VAGGPSSYTGQGFSPRGEKGRFVLPSDFRSEVKASSDGQRILCLDKHDRYPCLVGFGLSRAEAFAAQLDREEQNAIARGQDYDRDLRAMQLYGYVKVSFDDSGRFILPDHIAGLGGIGEALYFHGGGAFFSLWNPETLFTMGAGWEAAQANCRALMADGGAGKRGRK
jgi:MraZ protein